MLILHIFKVQKWKTNLSKEHYFFLPNLLKSFLQIFWENFFASKTSAVNLANLSYHQKPFYHVPKIL